MNGVDKNVLSVLLRYTDSDYPFGLFKLYSVLLILSEQHSRFLTLSRFHYDMVVDKCSVLK